MAETLVLRERTGHVATLTLNAPESGNALDERLLDALREALTDLGEDDGIRVVCLTLSLIHI